LQTLAFVTLLFDYAIPLGGCHVLGMNGREGPCLPLLPKPNGLYVGHDCLGGRGTYSSFSKSFTDLCVFLGISAFVCGLGYPLSVPFLV